MGKAFDLKMSVIVRIDWDLGGILARMETTDTIALRITVRTFLNSQTLSLLTVPCSLFPVPLRVAL